MRKYFILPLLLVLAMGLLAPLAFTQTTGSVKGVCKDVEGKPIAGAEVEWSSAETGHKYPIKTNNKGEYFSLGVVPGKYTVKLSKDGKELYHFSGVTTGLDEFQLDFDLKKEQAGNAAAQGKTPEQIKAEAEQREKAAKEGNTVKALNDKMKEASAASEAGDYDKALASLNDANALD